jgi:hypothetical protein
MLLLLWKNIAVIPLIGLSEKPEPALPARSHRVAAYSGEDDRLFRRNVTGDSAESALLVFSTRVGHDQSRFLDFEWSLPRV